MKFKWDVAFVALAVTGAMLSGTGAIIMYILGNLFGTIATLIILLVCVFAAGGILGGMSEQEEDESKENVWPI